ncbi:unnamed protein product [Lactuca saligna]|uniref:Uncharacterized protein n=1 Tax=Lactuca saligna TaxID=75948 RepID=A0AA36EFB0_LACSI|nr:unnamed protein product [Lactuca saligna]
MLSRNLLHRHLLPIELSLYRHQNLPPPLSISQHRLIIPVTNNSDHKNLNIAGRFSPPTSLTILPDSLVLRRRMTGRFYHHRRRCGWRKSLQSDEDQIELVVV